MNTLRNDLICAALTGLCANPHCASNEWMPDDYASFAINIADATLAKINKSPITGSAEVDWSQAPAWAMWHAWDEILDGRGCWYGEAPYWTDGKHQWWTIGPKCRWKPSDLTKPANLAARDSLTRRPGK